MQSCSKSCFSAGQLLKKLDFFFLAVPLSIFFLIERESIQDILKGFFQKIADNRI